VIIWAKHLTPNFRLSIASVLIVCCGQVAPIFTICSLIILLVVFETSVWHTYHHARQASVTLLCNWVGDLSIATLGGPENFVNYFIATVSNEAAEFDV
jgi:hypothetical protein